MHDEVKSGKRLVVLLHSFQSHYSSMDSIRRCIESEWTDADFFVPDLPTDLWSTHDPDKIASGLLKQIDEMISRKDGHESNYESIVFVGHSLGSLLARKIYMVACGEIDRAPFESVYHELYKTMNWDIGAMRPWAPRVERIILLAGMNRGWRISHHLNFEDQFSWRIGNLLGSLYHNFMYLYFVLQRVFGLPNPQQKKLLIFSIKRGAEFITQLRIQWILMRHRAKRGKGQFAGNATTIQLLGSQDDMVAPEDNVDLVSGGDFVYLDVPYSGHANIREFDHPEFGPGRREVFLQALLQDPASLEQSSVVPSDADFIKPVYKIKRMVFVIHGIRDVGYWTHKIARRVKQVVGDQQKLWATETSSYGYFPMLPFLLPGYRREKVEWLMDQYAEALARYPDAKISYVGHSNGSFLLAKALEVYPCCQFENVVFAGSVVNRNYDWNSYLHTSPKRVNAVLNIVGSKDWVVAFFPKVFQFFGFRDLGSAGHDGFTISQRSEHVHDIKYVAGSHSAGIAEPMWDVIAKFVSEGEITTVNQKVRTSERNSIVEFLSRFPPLVWIFILLVLCLIWNLIDWTIRSLFCIDPYAYGFWKGMAIPIYWLLIWLVVTRV